jgi:hypothetical protein
MQFKVKWRIKKTKFYPRQQGVIIVDATCKDRAKEEAQFALAQALIVHAAMVVPYRVCAVSGGAWVA